VLVPEIKSYLVLEDGSTFAGYLFGYSGSTSGEVVFNTGMVGYPESLTDPSYKGQILVLTYPLVGNYGVPKAQNGSLDSIGFESDRIQAQGLVISEYSSQYSHWDASRSLEAWLKEHHVPALYGVDTRMLTRRLREKGSLLGQIVPSRDTMDFHDPNQGNLVEEVSVKYPCTYGTGKIRVLLVDCGCKNSIIRKLLVRGVTVVRVPWNYNFSHERFDGVVISNGPGDPKLCSDTIEHIRRLLGHQIPIFGICLGHQILALAAGADTYKLKFGHRGQNQPCLEVGTPRCYITSQNHGYAVRAETLPDDWEPWFVNANDGTNEGIRHRIHPFMGVQFHPEASPGPVDTEYLFDRFLSLLPCR
jgi:carbamoyl-phosphate synthase small subunit